MIRCALRAGCTARREEINYKIILIFIQVLNTHIVLLVKQKHSKVYYNKYIFISIKKALLNKTFNKKCPVSESNQRHKDFQSFALPTELTGHTMQMHRVAETGFEPVTSGL